MKTAPRIITAAVTTPDADAYEAARADFTALRGQPAARMACYLIAASFGHLWAQCAAWQLDAWVHYGQAPEVESMFGGLDAPPNLADCTGTGRTSWAADKNGVTIEISRPQGITCSVRLDWDGTPRWIVPPGRRIQCHDRHYDALAHVLAALGHAAPQPPNWADVAPDGDAEWADEDTRERYEDWLDRCNRRCRR